MKARVLTQKSQSLFATMGGWRTVAEIFASRVVFLIAYLLTGEVWFSALTAVGAVVVFAATLLGTPAIAVCVYFSWRILRVSA